MLVFDPTDAHTNGDTPLACSDCDCETFTVVRRPSGAIVAICDGCTDERVLGRDS